MAGYTYKPFTYGAYIPEVYEKSQDVLDAEKKKTEAEKALAGFGDYSWAKQGEYDKLLSDYQKRKDFSYDFNTDALYQQYKDKYIQQGKMAMADTMGQAAAMTGGYGNSYAATVGNQAYQAQLQNLNDIIPQLYQMAYDRYNQKGQDMLNMIGLLGNERTFDYGTWSDKYNRLASDRGYYADEADNAFNRDYGVWSDKEDRRWNKYDSDRDLAYSDHTTSEGYRYQTGRDAVADEQWEKEYKLKEAELDLKKNSVTSSGSGSSGSGSSSGSSGGSGGSTEFDYSSMSATDWSDLFKEIMIEEGWQAAQDWYNKLDSQGLIPEDMKYWARFHLENDQDLNRHESW